MRQPHPNAPGLPLLIDEPMIRQIVHDFYAQIREDRMLGPIFNTRIEDWDAHLEKLCHFWASVTLLTGSYKGTPLQAHLAMPNLSPVHFERWLSLFAATLRRLCTQDQAALFMDRATRISQSFQMALAQQRGEMPSGCPVSSAR